MVGGSSTLNRIRTGTQRSNLIDVGDAVDERRNIAVSLGEGNVAVIDAFDVPDPNAMALHVAVNAFERGDPGVIPNIQQNAIRPRGEEVVEPNPDRFLRIGNRYLVP